jgi:hypothetical protein
MQCYKEIIDYMRRHKKSLTHGVAAGVEQENERSTLSD